MGCEVCLPIARGYTVYFAEEENALKLASYFQSFQEDSWKFIADRFVWLKESILFDLLDYFEAHMTLGNIYAVVSSLSDPLKNLNDLRPIGSFKQEREASWIDTVIEKSSLCTHFQPIVKVTDGN